jgi:predicted nucleic acid-binding Zn ribbon protein
MTTTFDLEPGCITKEEFHRLRGGPATNGDAPAVATRPPLDGPTCETCGAPLTGKQDRFCSRSCGLVGARREQRQRLANPEQMAAGIGLLVAQVVAVAQVGEVEVQFAGVRLLVRTRAKEK